MGTSPSPSTPPGSSPSPVSQGSVPGLKKSRKKLWVVVAVVVVVIVAVLALVGYTYAVNVTGIIVASTDNSCGIRGQTAGGYTSVPGAHHQVTLSLHNTVFIDCTITSVSANTSGFSVSGGSLPLSIPADQVASVTLDVTSPGGFFSGTLTIDFE